MRCRLLGWEAATERFLAAAEIGPREWPSLPMEIGESMLWGVYKTFTGQHPERCKSLWRFKKPVAAKDSCQFQTLDFPWHQQAACVMYLQAWKL